MNAYHLPLIAGLVAVLAIGVLGAAPGGITGPSAGGASSCPLHVVLAVPGTIPANGAPVAISAAVTTTGSCAMVVHDFAFLGLPQTQGAVISSTGVVLIDPSVAGAYQITVTAYTSLGTASATTGMQVV
jgi:hypothetical protein